MCGIVGAIQYESELPREVRQKALKILFSDVFLRTLPRGRDATGMYQVHRDGDWMMTKKGEKVTDWMFRKRDEDNQVIYQDFVDSWIEHPQELMSVVGHCRAATVGSRGQNNEDNHPFAIQVDKKNSLLMVHNGTLHNHETIWKKLPGVAKRRGTVDSEVLAHFLFYLTKYGSEKVTPEMLKYLAKRVDGAYTVVSVNSNFPEQVVAFRKERPLDICLISPLNLVILASEKKFFEEALNNYEMIRNLIDPSLPEITYTDRVLADRMYCIFDTEAPFPKTLNYESLGKISKIGDIATFTEPIESGWKGATSKPYSTGYGSYSYPGSHSHYGHKSAGTSSSSREVPKVSKNTPLLPASTKKNEGIQVEGEVVDDKTKKVSIEIGSEEEAKKSFISAKSLGLCIDYDTVRQVADVCNVSERELTALTGLEVANRVSKSTFSTAYALGRTDSQGEIDELKRSMRTLVQKLERTTDKQKKAEKRIWEMKTILAIVMALKGAYSIGLSNVSSILSSFKTLNKQRRDEVLSTYKDLIQSKDFHDTVADLIVKIKQTENERTTEASG